MIIYETADSQLWTHDALYNERVRTLRAEWDPANGVFNGGATYGRFYLEFGDWLIEAINTGVIKEHEVHS